MEDQEIKTHLDRINAETDPLTLIGYAKALAGPDLPEVIKSALEARLGELAVKGSNGPADPYNVTADELRQFIERFEQLESEKSDISEQQKELMAEAKGRGYDTKVMRKVIALRKRKPDDVAEEEAVLEMYKAALGMS